MDRWWWVCGGGSVVVDLCDVGLWRDVVVAVVWIVVVDRWWNGNAQVVMYMWWWIRGGGPVMADLWWRSNTTRSTNTKRGVGRVVLDRCWTGCWTVVVEAVTRNIGDG
jgi:hypothetical protein